MYRFLNEEKNTKTNQDGRNGKDVEGHAPATFEVKGDVARGHETERNTESLATINNGAAERAELGRDQFGRKTILRAIIEALANTHHGTSQEEDTERASDTRQAREEPEDGKAESDHFGFTKLVAENPRGNLQEGIGKEEDTTDQTDFGITEREFATDQCLNRVQNHAVGVNEDPTQEEKQHSNFPVGLYFLRRYGGITHVCLQKNDEKKLWTVFILGFVDNLMG